GSFAALASAPRIRQNVRFRRLGWSAVTALALGGGIWSMHFVGMVAYHIGMTVTFDLTLTALSLFIAVSVSGVGIWVVADDPFNAGRLVGGGTFAGLGIAAMHYTGMAAMRTSGTIGYRPGLVLLSIAVAGVAAVAAFWIAFHVGGIRRVFGASLVMAAAVCGMHYTAMAATRVAPDPVLSGATAVDPFALGILAAFGSVIVMMFIILAALGGVSDEFSVQKITRDQPPTGPKAAPPWSFRHRGTWRIATRSDGSTGGPSHQAVERPYPTPPAPRPDIAAVTRSYRHHPPTGARPRR
ncbi:MAG: MHYT domain-containing protein, partial [Frankia sp.]